MKKILVADDAEDIREMLEKVLEEDGWDVTIAEDGREALYLYHSALHDDDPFDVLLLDKVMPRLNGIAVGVNVRNLENLGDAPRAKHFYISGKDDDQLEELTEMSWADGFLLKPFDLEELLKMVRS